MKKKIALIQMDVKVGKMEENYAHAEALMTEAMKESPDILVLPETLNTGFFPQPAEALHEAADPDGKETQSLFGAFAKKYGVHIVAGSAAVLGGGKVYNRSYVFDRSGAVIAAYDKVHGFSPMGETEYFTGGDHPVHFKLDGIPCSMAVCYDIRFPEWIRTETLCGVDLFFLPAAWPLVRKEHWVTLAKARAIENQMYFCAVNECGLAGATKFGGHSLLLSPWGEEICHLGESEEIQTGEIDLDVIRGIREGINVFRDRRPELYHV